ncbi:uncharacterized protein LOC128952235 [Oppia nitens]|uniref:uncharacterized protein LOC128952235 n=1 Tax=Oppia nitens TaxID=1686743 RepID=UPI0023DC9AD7|nr:uncharacterized protein LOC128952235 [Oppia nitens]
MTRVWSLSTNDETQENQLRIVWKNNSKLLSFDSGYESSLNSQSIGSDINDDDVYEDEEALDFDHNNFDDAFDDEITDVNTIEDNSNRCQQSTHVVNTTSSHVVSPMRAQSSPIPIPQNPYRRYRKRSTNRPKSRLSVDSGFDITPLSSTITPSICVIDSVDYRIGHPPYDCGCIRGYYQQRHLIVDNTDANNSPHMPTLQSGNSSVSPASQSSSLLHNVMLCNNNHNINNQSTSSSSHLESDVCKKLYPLPDIISSSQSRALMNEIIREIGSDLRRVSNDFITTSTLNTNKERSMLSAVTTRLITSLAIPLILREVVSQLF